MLSSFRFKPFKGRILLTNDIGKYCFLTNDEFKLFLKGELNNPEKLHQLEDNFFCYSGSKEAYLQRAQEAYRENHSYLFTPTSLFIVALTNRCNNNCIYCQASGKLHGNDMQLTVARKIVERIAETPATKLTIEFQGGEPLLNYSAVKEVVLTAEQMLSDRSLDFALVSNLALLTDEMADFFAAHHISVSTSIDGDMALHDLNRPTYNGKGSFQTMIEGLQLLHSRGLTPGAIQTTTRASLSNAKRIVDTYIELGFSSIFLRPLTRLGAAAHHWDQIGYTPDEFLTFYQEALDHIIHLNLNGISFSESHASIFLSKMLNGISPNYMELRSPCGAGLGQVAFTASGDVFTCDEGRMLAEDGDYSFRIGNVFENGYGEWIECGACKATCAASVLEAIPGCCDCVYQPYCGVCPVVNYALEGNLVSTKKNNDRCKIYQGIQDILMGYLMEDDARVISAFQSWN